jgi:hypothetical protein
MHGVYKRKNNSLWSLCVPVVAGISGSLESIPGLLKRFHIRAQATLASGIGSLESIPGLLKLEPLGLILEPMGLTLEPISHLGAMKAHPPWKHEAPYWRSGGS